MIVCNGIVGLCLLAGGVRHHEQDFKVQGERRVGRLAALSPSLILPNVTTTTPVRRSARHSCFCGAFSLVLWLVRLRQTVRHRDYFSRSTTARGRARATATGRTALISADLLLVTLVAVVGLARP
jgi:Ca2+:H+ antiporter